MKKSNEMQCLNRQNHKQNHKFVLSYLHLTVESRLIFLLLLGKKKSIVVFNKQVLGKMSLYICFLFLMYQFFVFRDRC